MEFCTWCMFSTSRLWFAGKTEHGSFQSTESSRAKPGVEPCICYSSPGIASWQRLGDIVYFNKQVWHRLSRGFRRDEAHQRPDGFGNMKEGKCRSCLREEAHFARKRGSKALLWGSRQLCRWLPFLTLRLLAAITHNSGLISLSYH